MKKLSRLLLFPVLRMAEFDLPRSWFLIVATWLLMMTGSYWLGVYTVNYGLDDRRVRNARSLSLLQQVQGGPIKQSVADSPQRQQRMKVVPSPDGPWHGDNDWRNKHFKTADDIRKYINTVFKLDRDIVSFSNFDQDTEKCHKHGKPYTDCRGETPVVRQKSCAIVGSSGIILNSSCGREIDQHDFVLRFNFAPLEEFKDDVGTKVDLVVLGTYKLHIYSNSFAPDAEDKKKKEALSVKVQGKDEILTRLRQFNNTIIFYPKPLYELEMGVPTGPNLRLQQLMEVLEEHQLRATMAYNLVTLKDLTVEMLQKLYPDAEAPSVGVIAYLIALTFCDQLDLYGFYPLDYDPWNRTVLFHYHDDPLPGHGLFPKPHHYNTEYEFMRELDAKGVFTYHIDKCT
ncbi:CMP-N-acetylneuraminate-poly-alpha-2,8-sialyltransferase-like [Branchiostoma floridae x Branchiostoma japonicum]